MNALAYASINTPERAAEYVAKAITQARSEGIPSDHELSVIICGVPAKKALLRAAANGLNLIRESAQMALNEMGESQ